MKQADLKTDLNLNPRYLTNVVLVRAFIEAEKMELSASTF